MEWEAVDLPRRIPDRSIKKAGAETWLVSTPIMSAMAQRMTFHERRSGAATSGDRNSLYFLPRIASLAALATRNFTTRFAGILISSPV